MNGYAFLLGYGIRTGRRPAMAVAPKMGRAPRCDPAADHQAQRDQCFLRASPSVPRRPIRIVTGRFSPSAPEQASDRF
jgi:hypothetical protein